MSAVGTGQVSPVETGQMPAAGIRQRWYQQFNMFTCDMSDRSLCCNWALVGPMALQLMRFCSVSH